MNKVPKESFAAMLGGPISRDDDEPRMLSEQAYERLRTSILNRQLPSRTVLSEADIAESLGISRTPVRTALDLLLKEGLVKLGPRRQPIVRELTARERHEVFLLRDGLERIAVREACRTMPLEQIDQLYLLLRRQRREAEGGHVNAFIELDEEFHLSIAAGADLPTLYKFLSQLRAFIRLMGVDAVLGQPRRMESVIAEHEAIIEAIERRDEQAAMTSLSHHLAETESILRNADILIDEDAELDTSASA